MIYVLVEGESDVTILSPILRSQFPETVKWRFYPAGGFYAMLSSIGPVLDVAGRGDKILFVFDADTNDPIRAEEKKEFVKEHIGSGRLLKKMGVFCFIPTIDAIIPCGWEVARIKRHDRLKYNQQITGLISDHLQEIVTKSPIADMVEFLKKKEMD